MRGKQFITPQLTFIVKTMHILILGNHPIRNNLIAQYQKRGDKVDCYEELDSKVKVDEYDEVCVLNGGKGNTIGFDDDQERISTLEQLAEGYNTEKHDGRRMVCHLLISSKVTMQLLRSQKIEKGITDVIELRPIMLDEEWGRSIQLDREPITVQSEKTVHLVVVGWSNFAESLVINAAHVAHYPNYVRNNKLRTRITIIHDGDAIQLINDYKTLFDNSYYRVFYSDFKEKEFHKPQTDVNGVVTDIEWEFVEAPIQNTIVEEKLRLWSTLQDKQILTIAVTHEDDEQNLKEAFHITRLTENVVPVYVHMRSASLLRLFDGQAEKIEPVGMLDLGYDVNSSLVEMAKTVNAVYQQLKKEKPIGDASINLRNLTYVAQIDSEERNNSWKTLPMTHRMSSIYHAMGIPTKMRSVGIMEEEWERFYDLSLQDVELMAQVEHNRWCMAELLMGYRPCTAEEREIIDDDIRQKEVYKRKKVHYDICSYDMLKVDEHGMDVVAYDLRLCASMPIIVKSVAARYGEEKAR